MEYVGERFMKLARNMVLLRRAFAQQRCACCVLAAAELVMWLLQYVPIILVASSLWCTDIDGGGRGCCSPDRACRHGWLCSPPFSDLAPRRQTEQEVASQAAMQAAAQKGKKRQQEQEPATGAARRKAADPRRVSPRAD